MKQSATVALAPLGWLYGAAMKVRAAFYRRGLFRTYKIDAPVISVGNLTVGGTGKTPLVEWIARELAQQGHRVCVLTRGYGRENPRQRVIVSDGHEILSDATQTGDEALMLAENLKGKAAVICDADRVSAASWALEHLKAEVFVLDDGFQNLRIARDLNIVTIDATNPWGNQRVLPAGTLREPIGALRRADCVMLTRVQESTDATLRQQIQEASEAVVLSSDMVASQVRAVNSEREDPGSDLLTSGTLAAFCGIGNSQAFFHLLRRDNFQLVHTRAFRDHHRYSQSQIDQLMNEAIARGAQALITTAKDEVKLRNLRFDLPCYVIDIEIRISSVQKFRDLIHRAVHKP